MESQITGTSVQRRPGAIHFCNASVTWTPKRSCSADGEKCLQNLSDSDVKIAFTRQTPRCHAVWSLLQASRIALTFLQVLAHRLETGVVWLFRSSEFETLVKSGAPCSSTNYIFLVTCFFTEREDVFYFHETSSEASKHNSPCVLIFWLKSFQTSGNSFRSNAAEGSHDTCKMHSWCLNVWNVRWWSWNR